jgi:hypothetical protein
MTEYERIGRFVSRDCQTSFDTLERGHHPREKRHGRKSASLLASSADVKDQNRTFRTRLVIAWLLSNAGLAIVISSINGLDQTKLLVEACLPGGDAQLAEMNRTCIVTALNTDSREVQSKQQVYFKYLLWATFGLSSVRFIGVSSASHVLGR